MDYTFKKIKKRTKFLCALCSSQREMKYSKNLSKKHYLQIFLTSFALTVFAWDLFGIHSLISIPVFWCALELVNKALYRKEIPCPHCGFDATWYKRDIKVAKSKVEDFWENKNRPSDKEVDLEALL